MSRRQQLLNQGLKRPKFTEDEGCRIVGERFHSNSFIFRQPNNASDETIRFPNDANPNTQRNHNAIEGDLY